MEVEEDSKISDILEELNVNISETLVSVDGQIVSSEHKPDEGEVIKLHEVVTGG